LFAAALPVRLRSTPAFALERLPNRDSLIYGDLYGISKEASTVFRATLRYQGFSKIMDALGELGYFDTDPHPLLDSKAPPTYNAILDALLSQNIEPEEKKVGAGDSNSLAHALAALDCCKNDSPTAESAATCIRWLGLDASEPVPQSCRNIFEVLCKRMEEKLTFRPDEKVLVFIMNSQLLHHPTCFGWFSSSRFCEWVGWFSRRIWCFYTMSWTSPLTEAESGIQLHSWRLGKQQMGAVPQGQSQQWRALWVSQQPLQLR
jgi:alpha-aminoadipic semialdehyde synthase